MVLVQVVEHMPLVIASTSKILPSKRTRMDPSEDPIIPAINLEAERKIKALEAELARANERSPLDDTISSNTCPSLSCSQRQLIFFFSEQNLQRAPDPLRAHL